MRSLAPLLVVIAMGAAPASAWAARPVVVELYTAQGCQACTKANGLTDELSQREDVLALTFPVDYWDYLGWTDTFAKPEFADRQRAYMRPLGQREVYTPQVVIEGRAQASGSRADKVLALLKTTSRSAGPRMRFWGGGFVRVGPGAAPKGGADVWLVRYQERPEPVEVTEGEARGQTLGYVNVVRELVRLGGWTGRQRTFALPDEEVGLKTVVLLQAAKGGRILGVLQR